jgi:ketosteroid isomerase-like protein
MKLMPYLSLSVLLLSSCQQVDKEEIKKEIFQAEKAFEKMTAEKSVAEAFYHFADDNAVIKRQNDTLIVGKENIKIFYEKNRNNDATVNWTPDFIDVADDGTLAYTYGKYSWKIKNKEGALTEYKGVFHTVWKKQKDGSWKYVWD